MKEGHQLSVPGSRLSSQEVSYLRTVRAHERLPFLRETCLPTLNITLYRFATSFENDLAEAARTNSSDTIRNHVLFVEGPPGAGKSYLTRHTILPFLRSSAERWRKTYDIDAPIIHLHWDHIEEILTERNIISPEERKPFSKRDLEITGMFMNLLTAYKIKKADGDFSWQDIKRHLIDSGLIQPEETETYKDFIKRIRNTFNYMIDTLQLYHEPSVLVIEKPGPTALKYSLGWGTQTRAYNSRMIDDMNYTNPDSVFQNVRREDLVIGTIGIVPGPNMNALVAYRAELQKTNSWQDADTDELNDRYGLPPFTTEDEWKAARVGASLAVMDVASNAIRMIIAKMLSAAENQMLAEKVYNMLLPAYLLTVLRGAGDFIRNPELFFGDMELYLRGRQRHEWENLKLETDAASSYFNRSYPLMLWSACADLAAGLVMDNNFGDVDFKTIIRNNPEVHPRKIITVPLLHQQGFASDRIYP